jgi:hypothetical protein
MSPADAEIVRRPDVRDLLVADLREAFLQGSDGPAEDMVLLGRPPAATPPSFRARATC